MRVRWSRSAPRGHETAPTSGRDPRRKPVGFAVLGTCPVGGRFSWACGWHEQQDLAVLPRRRPCPLPNKPASAAR